MIKNQHIRWAAPALLMLVCACEPKVDNRGYIAGEGWKERIVVGSTTREDVMGALGSPSALSSFGDESWYYITSRKETVAFLKPEIVEQEVVRISFDGSGVVSKIERFDKESSRNFDIAKRVTPTEGHEMGFIEQIVGNIGRFNKGGTGSAAPGRQPNPGGI